MPHISKKEHLINEEITVPQVRLVGEDGEQIGVVAIDTAQNLSIEKGLDLVMIAPQATPPVCRIMDYGKFRFEQDKREKEAKKKQQTVEIKEIQLSCSIGAHDFQTKLNHAFRFLKDGNKVKVCVRFKGREMRHTELGMEVIMRFAEAASEYAQIDGRQIPLPEVFKAAAVVVFRSELPMDYAALERKIDGAKRRVSTIPL